MKKIGRKKERENRKCAKVLEAESAQRGVRVRIRWAGDSPRYRKTGMDGEREKGI